MTNKFEIDWRGIVLIIMVGFELGMSKKNLMLEGLLGELTLMWIMDMSDVDFEDVFVGHEEHFGQQHKCQFIGEIYGDNFGEMSKL